MSPMEEQWIRGPTIGYGSSASLYLATSAKSGELFAVKSKELSQAGDLKNEQSILSSLNSPHIVSYLGFDIPSEILKDKQMFNLFLEYAPGGSLRDEIKRNNGWLTEDRIQTRTAEILHGLVYLHEQGIVHCDIKSQNVLIGSNGCAKIADFGCAKKGIASKNQPVRGTPIFMAPEVARGEEQGMPADIWALGCTVIEMSTGGSPWEGFSDPISAMHKIGFSHEVPIVPSWLSEEAKDFLSKCLKRNPTERWSGKELLKHPFITSSDSKQSMRETWVSPTSNLDQGFWESLSSLEGEDEEANMSERIKAIIGEFSGEPDWSWGDASWVTVRCNGEAIEIEESITSSSVTSEVEEVFLVRERNLEESLVSVMSSWVGDLDEMVLSENEISVCNCDYHFEHHLVTDCVKQTINSIFQKLSAFVKKKKRCCIYFIFSLFFFTFWWNSESCQIYMLSNQSN